MQARRRCGNYIGQLSTPYYYSRRQRKHKDSQLESRIAAPGRLKNVFHRGQIGIHELGLGELSMFWKLSVSVAPGVHDCMGYVRIVARVYSPDSYEVEDHCTCKSEELKPCTKVATEAEFLHAASKAKNAQFSRSMFLTKSCGWCF